MGSDHVSKLNDCKDKYSKAEQSLLSEKNWKKSLIVLGIVVVLVFVWNLQLISSGILARAKSAEPEKTVTQNDGGQTDSYRPEDVKPDESEEEKLSVSEADFVGTYVGADGSVLVIYPGHVADYYFKDWDHIEEDDAWKYADGRITISSPEIGCDFYAEAKDGQTEELLFTSDTLFKWKDEKYSKTDASAKKLTLEEARATIEKKLGVTLEPLKSVDEFTFLGLVFPVPDYYIAEKIEKENQISYVSNSGKTGLLFTGEKDEEITSKLKDLDGIGISQSDILAYVVRYALNTVEESLGDTSGFSNIECTVAGCNAVCSSGSLVADDGTKVFCSIYVILNPQAGSICAVIFFVDESNKDRYVNDFENMIKEVRLDDDYVSNTSDDNTRKSADNNTSTNDTIGIRPEIKEAIDSYEAFMDKYCEFMKSYDASDMSALTTYLSMMEQYSDTMEKFDALEADLTDAEMAYYTEVQLRVSQKLLKVIQ